MSLIIREVVGWLFVLIGLGLIYLGLSFLDTRQVVEAMITTMSAGLVFRGGIHLIKVATAARIVANSSPQRGTSSE